VEATEHMRERAAQHDHAVQKLPQVWNDDYEMRMPRPNHVLKHGQMSKRGVRSHEMLQVLNRLVLDMQEYRQH
jgi:hypothetical protein